jgi:hypothetical protein
MPINRSNITAKAAVGITYCNKFLLFCQNFKTFKTFLEIGGEQEFSITLV